MGYLRRLPTRKYPNPRRPAETIEMRDVTFAINILHRNMKEEYLRTYELSDGERPEIASYRLYGDPDHYWILLLLNDAVDPMFDWYLSEEQVKRLTLDRYGSLTDVHHYEDNEGNWVDPEEHVGSPVVVRNIDFEMEENEKKKRIKAIKPKYIQKIISQLESAVEATDE